MNLTMAICMSREVAAADLLVEGASQFLAGDLIGTQNSPSWEHYTRVATIQESVKRRLGSTVQG